MNQKYISKKRKNIYIYIINFPIYLLSNHSYKACMFFIIIFMFVPNNLPSSEDINM